MPIIGFPRRAGVLYEKFAVETKVDCIALDHTPPLKWIKENIQKHCAVQGNLDNIYLTLDLNDAQERISTSVIQIIKNLYNPSTRGFIFNLGHGCLPDTKIENLEYVINKIRNIF
jgi:uroporphyrinogen decarboxylase